MGHIIAARAQAVAIKYRADVLAIGEHDGRRSVPGLHNCRVILVEILLELRHVGVRLPGFRNHHHHCFLQRAATQQQEFQHGVETARVRAVGIDNGKHLLQFIAVQIGIQGAFPGHHLVDVAAQGIDLTIVAHKAIGLGSIPGRESIGAEP